MQKSDVQAQLNRLAEAYDPKSIVDNLDTMQQAYIELQSQNQMVVDPTVNETYQMLRRMLHCFYFQRRQPPNKD